MDYYSGNSYFSSTIGGPSCLLLLCFLIVGYFAAEYKAKLRNDSTCSLLALIRILVSLNTECYTEYFAIGF